MIAIDFKSRKPIYEQLVEGIKRLAACGMLEPESQLPSVRQLSGELGINPNTVQRAYTMLELQGVIYTMPGKGNFISENQEQFLKERVETTYGKLSDNVSELKDLGATLEEIKQRVKKSYEGSAEK